MLIRIIFLIVFGALLYRCDTLVTDFASHKCQCQCKCQDENNQSENVTFDCESGRKCSDSNGSVCVSSGDDPWAGALAECFRTYVPIRQ